MLTAVPVPDATCPKIVPVALDCANAVVLMPPAKATAPNATASARDTTVLLNSSVLSCLLFLMNSPSNIEKAEQTILRSRGTTGRNVFPTCFCSREINCKVKKSKFELGLTQLPKNTCVCCQNTSRCNRAVVRRIQFARDGLTRHLKPMLGVGEIRLGKGADLRLFSFQFEIEFLCGDHFATRVADAFVLHHGGLHGSVKHARP